MMKNFYYLFLFVFIIYSCDPFDEDLHSDEIAYVAKNGDYYAIYLINIKDINPRVIVSNETNDLYCPYFIDSENLIFGSDGDIYKTDLSNNQYNLTNTPYLETEYCVSRYGEKMVYNSDVPHPDHDQQTEIYSYDLKTNDTLRLTFSKYYSFSPCISPDGNLFCFLSMNDKDSNGVFSNGASLVLRDFNGQIDDTLSNFAWTPAFSPDSKFLCYTVAYEGLHITDIYNHKSKFLVKDGFYPKYSPSGDKVYYQTASDNELVITRINIDGTNKIYYDTGQTAMGQFDISLDGEKIVYIHIYENKTRCLYLFDSNGENKIQLIPGYTPVFRP